MNHRERALVPNTQEVVLERTVPDGQCALVEQREVAGITNVIERQALQENGTVVIDEDQGTTAARGSKEPRDRDHAAAVNRRAVRKRQRVGQGDDDWIPAALELDSAPALVFGEGYGEPQRRLRAACRCAVAHSQRVSGYGVLWQCQQGDQNQQSSEAPVQSHAGLPCSDGLSLGPFGGSDIAGCCFYAKWSSETKSVYRFSETDAQRASYRGIVNSR